MISLELKNVVSVLASTHRRYPDALADVFPLFAGIVLFTHVRVDRPPAERRNWMAMATAAEIAERIERLQRMILSGQPNTACLTFMRQTWGSPERRGTGCSRRRGSRSTRTSKVPTSIGKRCWLGAPTRCWRRLVRPKRSGTWRGCVCHSPARLDVRAGY